MQFHQVSNSMILQMMLQDTKYSGVTLQDVEQRHTVPLYYGTQRNSAPLVSEDQQISTEQRL